MTPMISHSSYPLLCLVLPAVALAQDAGEPGLFSLTQDTEHTSEPLTDNWDQENITRLDAAEVQDFGTADLRICFGYATRSGRVGRSNNLFQFDLSGNRDGDDQDDDFGVRGEFQWGFMENMELELSMPINLGDGKDEGNYPLFVKWQWMLAEAQDWMPAIAVSNELRVGTYRNHGVDWQLKGIFTWDLVPDEMRLHLNPFIEILGNQEFENNRHYNVGGILGFDCKITEDLVCTADYVLETGEINGMSMQHLGELAIDWHFAENQVLAVGTQAQLDGDAQGPNWAIAIGYQYRLDNIGGFTYTN